MRKKSLILLILLLLMVVTVIPSVLAAPTGPRLRNISGDLLIGYASRNNFWSMSDAAQYQEVARTEFNFMTPENAMKWDALRPSQTSYSFAQADQHVQFAQANGMAVHGHVLIWHSQNPGWLENGNWSKSQLIGLMNDHIDTVAGRYAGDVLVWDVVNEAFNEDGTYRSTIWYNGIGQEYIDLAFQRARTADPNAKLIYNDYNIGWLNSKSNGVYNMVSSMVSRGIPIDGVGFQMHLTESGVDGSSFASNMQRFADLGLEVYITELDVRIPQNPSQQALQNQATIYQTVTTRCLAQPACKGLQVWGIPDKYSWVPDVFPGTGAPLLFDDNYNAKPAYYAVQSALQTANPQPTVTPGGPTLTPTLPATAVPTATPPPGGACVVAWTPLNQWSNVFQANVTITNNTSAPIAGWTLNFTHASGQTATGGWNATISQSGNNVTISNPASYWNGTIGANGGSVTFGLQGTFTGSVVIPTNFSVNGTACNQGNNQPTATPVPPTATAVPPTATSIPPTATSQPPTPTSVPPTATNVPPTATSIPPTATSLPPTATNVPPTATSQSAGGCAIDYTITNDWGSGFTANVTINNNSSSAINGWALGFSFPGNQTITNLWNGTSNQSGRSVTVNNASWNGNIPANGSTSFGFQGTYSGSNQKPASFTLNGTPCGGAPMPTATPPTPPTGVPPTNTPPTVVPPTPTSQPSVPPIAASVENTGADCPIPSLPGKNALPNITELPDPFRSINGTRISSMDQWRCRRAEIGAQAQRYMFGTKPAPPNSVSGNMNGNTIIVTVNDNGQSVSFSATISVPSGPGPHPAMIAIGSSSLNNSILSNMGVATITFNNDSMGAQSGPGSRGQGQFYQLYGSNHNAGSLMAWAWGVSRLIDALETTPGTNIDVTRLGVTGCSRNGKGALVAGAFDERIALTIPQESGSGGTSSFRVSQYQQSQGENIQTASSLHGEQPWMGTAFGEFTNSVNQLPIDLHEVMAMVAPRALYVVDNQIDWLGGFVSTPVTGTAAREVWKAMRLEDRAGVSNPGNHTHCQFPSSQNAELQAFVGKYLVGGGSGNTNFNIGPNVDTSRWITWSTPIIR